MKFIAPVLVAFSLVAFTDPEGASVYVQPEQVVSVTAPRECVPAAHAKLNLSNSTFLCVRETVAEAIERLTK